MTIASALLFSAAIAAVPSPQDTSRLIGEQFLRTTPEKYLPPGHVYEKPYGRGEMIHYSVASLWVNALECARIAGDADLERRLIDAWTPYEGEKRDKLSTRKHVDHLIDGAVPLEVALLTGSAKARESGLWFADRQWEEPLTNDILRANISIGDSSFENRHRWWEQGYSADTRLWIDDMYMMALLQSQAYKVTKDRKYVDRIAKEMCLYLDRLQRPDGLFNHSAESGFVWGRGDGWMAAAMPMILELVEADHPSRARIMDGYRRMMATLLKWQRPNGLWGQLVDDPGSWDESSCSAMFAYAFATGAKRGWLGPEYLAAAERAYAALVAKLDKWGNLADVCEGTGARNDRAWYMGRRRINGDPHGQCALLWLCRALMSVAE